MRARLRVQVEHQRVLLTPAQAMKQSFGRILSPRLDHPDAFRIVFEHLVEHEFRHLLRRHTAVFPTFMERIGRVIVAHIAEDLALAAVE